MNKELMFASENQAWATRLEVYSAICDFMNFGEEYDIDPAAEKDTAKCLHYLTKEEDMFSIPSWSDHFNLRNATAFMNPEYGREQAKFVSYFVKQVEEGFIRKGVCLVPARTDTSLFHKVILPKASTVCFIEGRLVFGTDEYWEGLWESVTLDPQGKLNPLYRKYGKFNSAPFPSMVVEFNSLSVKNPGAPIFTTMKAPKVNYRGKYAK